MRMNLELASSRAASRDKMNIEVHSSALRFSVVRDGYRYPLPRQDLVRSILAKSDADLPTAVRRGFRLRHPHLQVASAIQLWLPSLRRRS